MTTPSLAITHHFFHLKDPRVRNRSTHRFMDILVLALCGVLAGADTFEQIEAFGKTHRQWLEGFLPLPGGIPSHDTLERLFDRLEPQSFARGFFNWTAALCQSLGLKQVAIDGKSLRGSKSSELGMLHLVHAFCTENQLTLGQVAIAEKSNEITAIPQLLEMLELQGALVTIDAMGCQKKIAAQIIDQEGDYILPVKENQPHLLEDIKACLLEAFENDFEGIEHDHFERQERGHGRVEKRSVTIIHNPAGIRNQDKWKGLKVIGMGTSERTVGEKTSVEVRYFIGSRPASAQKYAEGLREHWGIENQLHWQLDVSFDEDGSRIHKRNAAENFATLRRLALALLKRHPSKGSIATKRLRAGWDSDFLVQLLQLVVNWDEFNA